MEKEMLFFFGAFPGPYICSVPLKKRNGKKKGFKKKDERKRK